jgi:hypothetical protein
LTASEPVSGATATDLVTVLIDNTLVTAPRKLAFYPDIETVINNSCISCHTLGGSVPGIPVWWTGNTSQCPL